MAVLFISYLIQLPLGYYAMFQVPLRGEIGGFAERARIGAIIFAFVPWPVISVVLQLFFLGIYLSKAKLVEGRADAISQEWQGSAPTLAPDANPFGDTGATTHASHAPVKPETENPFGLAPERSVSSSSANPFGSPDGASDSSGASAGPETANPFGGQPGGPAKSANASDHADRRASDGSPPPERDNPFA